MLRINVLGGLYVSDEGRPLSGAAAQPRRLALLALLALAGDRGVTRDVLLGYLWPEADEDRGRRALAQALYALRRDLGSDDAFLGMKDLRLNPELVASDVGEFHDALATGSLDRAAELYRGPFLEGFHLPGAETFERWVEDQRARLAHEYADLLDQLAVRASERGEHRVAVGWLRRLAAQDPLNARIACRLMESLAAHGDVAGALQHARVYETLVRQELDLPPDREVLVLADRLRAAAASQPEPRPAEGLHGPPAAAAPLQSTAATSPEPLPTGSPEIAAPLELPVAITAQGAADDPPAGPPSGPQADSRYTSGWAAMAPPETRSRPRRGLWWLAGGAVVVVAASLVATIRRWPRPAAEAGSGSRMVAVGRIAYYAATGGSALGQPLADMLATNLARAEGLQVVSSARMYEVLGQLASAGDTTAGTIVAAARRAGATELVDGSLYDVGSGRLRLDLRRVDLATGAVLRAYTVQGPDLFTLADSGTARLVGDIGGTAPSRSLADVSTRSVTAYRLYEEGLRSFYESDVPAAERLFESALKEDSTFAMAQFYYSRSVTQGTREDALSRLKRAVDLSERATDRERLLIKTTWAFSNSSPATRAYAETLMVRYPAELEGYLMAGQGAILEGDYGAAHRPLLEVVARDSLGLSGKAVRCLACEALETLGVCYAQEDSGTAALRTSRLWIRLQPGSSRAWRGHAAQLARLGQVDSALAALKVADSLDPGAPAAWRYLFALQLWNNHLAQAEELARQESQTGPAPERAEALWDLAIIYRHEGRLNEALGAATRFRQEQADVQSWGAAPATAYMQGQVLFEQGKFRSAAVLFDSISHLRIAHEDSSAAARNRIWTWTHMATALAALGDTSRLAGVADTLERLGRVSGLGRDRRLHHYVRGLLLRERGQPAPAVAEFRAAMLSPNMGYSRINLELGGALLRLGRPAEAIPILQSALRGSFEGSNLYVTHTELHDLLARAFEAAGRADSAAYHYGIVARAWEKADPQFAPRRQDAAERAMRLVRPG